MAADHPGCIHEERFAHIESELAEVNARLESKKEDIHQIQSERDRQNQLQMELIEKVTVVTTLLEQSQEQRKNNNQKIEDLEKKVDKLQNDFTDFVASQRSFRNTMLAAFGIGTPIISVIVAVILHFI